MHCGCKNNVGPAVSFSSSSCDSLSRILVKGKYFLQLLPLNWRVVFESVFCENVETKFKWRSRRVSDNFQKLLWRHFYGDKSCLICWIMRHIFDKLLKDEWMSTLDLRQAQIITGCKGICWKFKSSEPSEQCLFWMVGWQSVYFC